MTAYEYDEAGVMAAYFLITFLALVLVPFTLSTIFRQGGEYLKRLRRIRSLGYWQKRNFRMVANARNVLSTESPCIVRLVAHS